MQGQGTPEAVGKEDQVERPPWSRYSPRSRAGRGPRQRPQEDLHTSTNLSQEKLLSWGLAGEQRQMGWGTQQFRELWENTQRGRNSMVARSAEWRG